MGVGEVLLHHRVKHRAARQRRDEPEERQPRPPPARQPQREPEPEHRDQGEAAERTHAGPERDACRSRALAHGRGQEEIELGNGTTRQEAVRDRTEDHECHEAESQPQREIEAKVVAGRKATEQECPRGRRSRRKPPHRGRHEGAMPDRTFGPPCRIALFHQPAAGDGHRHEDRESNGHDECTAHQPMAERWGMVPEKKAHPAEHARPDRRARQVERREPREAHLREPGERRDQHACERNESPHQHRGGAMAIEKPARPGKNRRTHALGVSVEEIAPAAAERECHRCAQCGRYSGHQEDHGNGQPTMRRECGRSHEGRVRGERNRNAFSEDEQRDDQIPVVANQATEVADHGKVRVFRRRCSARSCVHDVARSALATFSRDSCISPRNA